MNATLFCIQKLPNGKIEEHELISCQGDEAFTIPVDMFVRRMNRWLEDECMVSEEFNFTIAVKL